ncbi:hypothetical protein ASL14_14220 [Paenibacillus sp. IHB B 3084]|uniref:hypothetical protein n=1 Tax=Paenibacillus sp. IHB B 3084 TaxID=867076 RepID=UPI0007201725|nr:hypothetical protein [Paenibacillus sp. IHB B 3084]ALP37162.1 hypothetical protein ASL14_14220 [Paenibacillus sp. IHB B 3084]
MEQQRFKDEYGYKYDFGAVIWREEQVAVHCPRCQEQAFISKSKKDCYYVIRCSHCYYACQEPESFKYDARGVCSHCERYFNIEIHDDRTATHKYTNIDCPHCETHNQVPVHRVASHEWRTNVIQDGKDPIFHLQHTILTMMRTASHSIPKYIKDAKNRQAILKILQKLQHKQASEGGSSEREYTNL